MRNLLKKILHPFLKFITGQYFSKPRKYQYKGIDVLVHPEVFPPHYTISTKVLLDHVDTLKLENKSLLELGCGSGIISLFAASKGADVVASDINNKALEYLSEASKKNRLPINIIHSDLFSNIKNASFDYVIINPPYYPKTPLSIKEQAWFCGENFEYFQNLFQQLSIRSDKNVLMILSEDCQIETIKNIANENSMSLISILEKTVLKEKNHIFRIENI